MPCFSVMFFGFGVCTKKSCVAVLVAFLFLHPCSGTTVVHVWRSDRKSCVAFLVALLVLHPCSGTTFVDVWRSVENHALLFLHFAVCFYTHVLLAPLSLFFFVLFFV